MTTASGSAPSPPLTQTREFWVLIAYAVALGVFGAFAGLVFMGVVKFGGKWYTDSNPHWFGGHWWWIAVTAAAGVAVGLLRRLTRLPEELPGLIADLKEQHVDPKLVPGLAAVSAVSLIGGASLGPEKALGSIGGGAGGWLSRRRGLSKEDSQLNTLVRSRSFPSRFSSALILAASTAAGRPGDAQVPVQARPGRDDPAQFGRFVARLSLSLIISWSWANMRSRTAASRSAPSGLKQTTNRSESLILTSLTRRFPVRSW